MLEVKLVGMLFALDPKVLGNGHQGCYCQRNLVQLPNGGLHSCSVRALGGYGRGHGIALFSDLSPKSY